MEALAIENGLLELAKIAQRFRTEAVMKCVIQNGWMSDMQALRDFLNHETHMHKTPSSLAFWVYDFIRADKPERFEMRSNAEIDSEVWLQDREEHEQKQDFDMHEIREHIEYADERIKFLLPLATGSLAR